MKGQVWIPHRPVIKTDDLTTTKIRPVFNCSLKSGQGPSLNEAAFPGINLMGNLLSLLLYFRTNNVVVLADILKAFLQIRLASEDDKNRFCFFRKINGQYVPYRYNTIIFGFVTSPFILNFIVQTHLAKNVDSDVTFLIHDKFYVDNLFLSSDNLDSLPQIVEETYRMMESGGLPLREWTSNDERALSLLPREICSDNSEAKVLGYLYNTSSDSMRLKNNVLDPKANTKRLIVSSLFSVFDPMGIYSPVLLAGKLVVRSLNQLNVGWDQVIEPRIQENWAKCCREFVQTNSLEFPRKTFSSDKPVKLFLFADASKEAYGCAIYALQDDLCSLVFTKSKLSPLKERTLPSLELLASYLALKCLKTILEDGLFVNINLSSVVLFVDSQVVLSWILTNQAPKKNIFVNNRLKEIAEMLENIKIKHVGVSFAYVPSQYNQADLLTKVCSGKRFCEFYKNWVEGPDWLRLPSTECPTGPLACIPHAVKDELISSAIEQVAPAPVIDIERFSSFSRLISVVSLVFKFVNKCRKLKERDPVEDAANFLMRTMQQDTFQAELDYLRNPSSGEPPSLVKKLNLFLDNLGIIRSKGRIDKNIELKYNVVNPIVMAKRHHLTKLSILYAHWRSMHMDL